MKKIILAFIVLIFLSGCLGKLSIEQAREIAQNSECGEKGSLKETYSYNENSKTWWIDLEMKEEYMNPICNPACVVSVETKKAEINWRCAGLLAP